MTTSYLICGIFYRIIFGKAIQERVLKLQGDPK